MNKQQFNRFNKLYNYLSNLESRKFTLKSFVDGSIEDLGKRKPLCNTRACISGYLPVVFPKEWSFQHDIVPLLSEDTSEMYSNDMSIFFGLDEQEVLQLTVAKNYQHPNLEHVLRRMKLLAKTYGFNLRREK